MVEANWFWFKGMGAIPQRDSGIPGQHTHEKGSRRRHGVCTRIDLHAKFCAGHSSDEADCCSQKTCLDLPLQSSRLHPSNFSNGSQEEISHWELPSELRNMVRLRLVDHM